MNRKIFIAVLLVLNLSGISYCSQNMNKGTRLYEKQDFRGAVEIFLKEQSKKPKDPVVNYNLASAYYKSGDFDKALETYETALNNSEDINFKSAILYNMGNCAYRKQDADSALQYYKSSLKLNSKDIQAKHNIEFLQSDKNKNKDNKNDKNKDDKKDKQQQSVQNDKKDQGKDKQQDKQKEQDKQQTKDKYLLDYFDNQDKQNQNRRQNAEVVNNKRNGKTW